MAYIGNSPAELVTELDNAVVTAEKLANDAVTAAKIVDGTIIADDLSTGIIVNSKVAANAAIAATKLAISGGSNITLQSDGTFDLDASVDVSTGYSVGGNVIVDSSRNATFATVGTPAGSAAAPAYTFSTDTNTGMFKRGTDQIGFTAGGTEYVAMGSFGLAVDTIQNKASAGDLTLDVAGDIILDAAGGEVRFSDGSQQEFVIDMNDAATKTALRTLVSNSDLVFEGNDGGVGFAALTLDMSEAGAATFNAGVTSQRLNVTSATGLSSLAVTTNAFTIGSTNDFNMAFDPNEIQARNNGAANDLILQKNGGSVGIQTTAPATMLQVGDAGGTSTSRQRSIRLSHQTGESSEYGGIEFYRAHQNSQKIGAAIIHQRPGTALEDSNLLFKTSTANQNATTRMTLTHDGKLGIGASDTEGFQMRVVGAIKLGTSGVTLGSTMLTGNYADGQEGWNIGSEYSTAAIQLMYGVKPSTTAANTYISSVDNANWKRSVLKTGEQLSFQTAGAQNTSVGTAVALTERFSVLADGRTTITSTASPALQVNSNADSARAIVANTSGTATFSYLELSTSSYGPGYLIKNIANSGNGMNNGSLYLWNSDSGGSGAIEFVPNQTIANRTTVEENGDLSVRGKVAILTTANDGLHIGSTASDYSGYGTGVPTISLQGTNNANRRAGAISFKEGDGTDTGAIYSTYGGDGYAGLNFHSKTEAIKFAVGGSSSSPADDIVTIEGGSNKSRLNVNYLANVYNGGLGGVYAYNGFIGANEISASGSDNDANVRVRVCIDTSTSVWRAGYCWVTASSCGSGGEGPVTAWWLYRFRTYNSSIGAISVADSGGDTSSFSVAFSDDGDPDGDGTSLVIGVRVASTHSTANDETTMGIVLGTREGPPRAAERISG